MLYTEWNLEDAIAVRCEEAREEEREKIRTEEREKSRQDKLSIARNLLTEGSTPEFVQKITGLPLEEIAKL